MPEVGYSREPERKELRTVQGGYVLLRRLPYDEILKRREMATRLSMEQTSNRRGRSRKEREDQGRTIIELAQVATREYEFKNCIVEHNLTVDGVDVDFNQPQLAFKVVDPKVLQEIEFYLSELNQETDEDELEDFLNAAKPSFSTEESLQPVTTETNE